MILEQKKKILALLVMATLAAAQGVINAAAQDSTFSGAVTPVNSVAESEGALSMASDAFTSAGDGNTTFLISTYTLNNNNRDGYSVTIESANKGYLLTGTPGDVDPTVTSVENGDKIDYKVKLTSSTGFDPEADAHWGDVDETSFSDMIGEVNDAPAGATSLGLAAGTDMPNSGSIILSFPGSLIEGSTTNAETALSLVIPNETDMYHDTFRDKLTVTSTNL